MNIENGILKWHETKPCVRCERVLLFSVVDDDGGDCGGGAIADDDYCFRVFKQFSDDVCHQNLANTEQTQRES